MADDEGNPLQHNDLGVAAGSSCRHRTDHQRPVPLRQPDEGATAGDRQQVPVPRWAGVCSVRTHRMRDRPDTRCEVIVGNSILGRSTLEACEVPAYTQLRGERSVPEEQHRPSEPGRAPRDGRWNVPRRRYGHQARRCDHQAMCAKRSWAVQISRGLVWIRVVSIRHRVIRLHDSLSFSSCLDDRPSGTSTCRVPCRHRQDVRDAIDLRFTARRDLRFQARP